MACATTKSEGGTRGTAIPGAPACSRLRGQLRSSLLLCTRGLSRLQVGAPFGLFVLCLLVGLRAAAAESDPAADARAAFTRAQEAYKQQPQDAKVAWQFARSCFDLADFATNRAQRAGLAQQGIAACRQVLAADPKSAPGHYYLGLNLGQLARTKTLGALRLVNEMEREFTVALELEPQFDYAGAERSIGLLYRDAPSIGSIGSRTKARQHLERALKLAPNYPENHLNLIESELKWNERLDARAALKVFEESLPKARKEFAGANWAASWVDWDNRLALARKALEEPSRIESPRH